MKAKVAALIFLGLVVLVQADQIIESVQQALKDQGFYYGEITGETNATLTAAIRRYQIRNGLQITGELNTETLRSLKIDSSASTQPAAKPTSSPSPRTHDLSERSPSDTAPVPPQADQPLANAPENRQLYPSNPVPSGTSPGGGLLAGTPYETAPSDVQRNVVISAQIALARRGLFRETIDGAYGPAMEFSLRAYQARTGLPVTGRLDLETLAALRLLPGARAPNYNPSHLPGRPRPQPPVHGEWIPE
jgi:peptidoglycan hydrolase-like protein with peptidoglycan-binding domain